MSGQFNVTVGIGPGAVLLSVTPKLRLPSKCYAQTNIGLFPTKAAAPPVHTSDAGACCAACDAMANCSSWLYNGPVTGSAYAPSNQTTGTPPRAHAHTRANDTGDVMGTATGDSLGNGHHFGYDPLSPSSSRSSCHGTVNNTDVGGPQSLPPKAGNVQCGATTSTCCSMCDVTAACTAWVLAPPSSWSVCPGRPYCFLLRGYARLGVRYFVLLYATLRVRAPWWSVQWEGDVDLRNVLLRFPWGEGTRARTANVARPGHQRHGTTHTTHTTRPAQAAASAAWEEAKL